MFCLKCGTELKEGEIFCSSCGTRIGDVGIENIADEKYPHELATILGYVFGFLGGWFGIIFGIYLLGKEHPKAKIHGKRILVFTIIMIIVWFLIMFLFPI